MTSRNTYFRDDIFYIRRTNLKRVMMSFESKKRLALMLGISPRQLFRLTMHQHTPRHRLIAENISNEMTTDFANRLGMHPDWFNRKNRIPPDGPASSFKIEETLQNNGLQWADLLALIDGLSSLQLLEWELKGVPTDLEAHLNEKIHEL